MKSLFLSLALLVSGAAFGSQNPAEEVTAFVTALLKGSPAELRKELVAVSEFCGGDCADTRVQAVLVDGLLGKQGYSVTNYLVTVSYLSMQSGLGHYRALPLIVERTTLYGKPTLRLASVLKFGSLESRLAP